VRAALAATGLPLAATRFRRALCNYQDLWVVVPDPGQTFADLTLQSEPEVVVERCELSTGAIDLAGWAFARHGSVVRVEAVLDGKLLGGAAVEGPRGDVAAAFGPAAERSGWHLRAALPADASPIESVLLVRAVDGSGGTHPMWSGRPLVAALRTAELQEREAKAALHLTRRELAAHQAWAAHEVEGLRARIAAMEASRFWKLRNAWFRLKRALRLTGEA